MVDLEKAVVRHGIKTVSFGMYTDTESRSRSVAEITSTQSFDTLGFPIPNGPYDTRMGPTGDGMVPCETCGNVKDYCPGHWGHVELCVPVYNPMMFRTILSILRTKCFHCHRLRLGKLESTALATRLKLLERGRYCEAIEIEANIRSLEPKFIRSELKSLRDKDGKKNITPFAYLKSIVPDDGDLDEYDKESEIKARCLNAHERTLQNEWIKEFLEKCDQRKTCAFCNAISPQVKAVGNNKIVQIPLSDKNKLKNLAEKVRFRSALSKLECMNNVHDDDDVENEKGYGSDDSNEDSVGGFFDIEAAENNGDDNIEKDGKTISESNTDTRTKDAEVRLNILEVRAQVQLTWRLYPYLCSRLFLLSSFQNQEKSYETLFQQVVAVPPSRFRPPAVLGNMTYDHPQNVNLFKIIELNDMIREAMAKRDVLEEGERGDEGSRVRIAWINLQSAVNAFCDNTKAGDIKNAGMGIRQLLEKKDGMFRKNIMGKRVNHACRSVISPDPYIGTNEIGIPVRFAKVLTFPECVSPQSYENLRKLVCRGTSEYPGAVWVKSLNNGTTYNLSRMPKASREALAARMRSGGPMTVGRQMVTGDMLLLNRQPTLHKPGIMAHKVRILHNPTQETIRMHYANCDAYNADFDGDEMNCHFPQDYLSQAEAIAIVSTDRQYLVPTDGSPVRGLIQDHVDGGVKLTSRDTFLQKHEFQQLLFAMLGGMPGLEVVAAKGDTGIRMVPPAIRKPVELWTGKQVITTLLWHLAHRSKLGSTCGEWGGVGVSLDRKCKTPPAAFGELNMEHMLLVRDGELLRGVLDKGAFGSTEFSLVHAIYEIYGPKVAGMTLNALGRLFTSFIQYYSGHSCRMEDLVLTEEADEFRRHLIKKAYNAGRRAAQVWADTDGGKSAIPEDEDGVNDSPMTAEEVAMARKKIRKLLSGFEGPENSAAYDSYMQGRINPLVSKVIDGVLPDGLANSRYPKNTFGLMVTSGAKGSKVNQSQITCSLGQQALEGRRVPRMPSGRTLPSFAPFDPHPRADGFIADRFLTGLRPQEYYFHCMAGREGLVDTAVKTSRAGYLQRCLMKSMEELVVAYDGTVRDAEGNLIQFMYGEDGIDPVCAAYLREGANQMEFLARNANSLLNGNIRGNGSFNGNSLQRAAEDAANIKGGMKLAVGSYVRARRLIKGQQTWSRRSLCTSGWHEAIILKVWDSFSETSLTVDLRYTIDDTIETKVPVKLPGNHNIEVVRLFPKDPVMCSHRLGVDSDCVSPRVAAEAMTSQETTKIQKILKSQGLRSDALATLVAEKYSRAAIQPGEAVGCLAAQSIGEPSTQMTLNTFHLAGSGANVTLGMPRLRELLMTASPTPKTPTMSVPLSPQLSDAQATAISRCFTGINLRSLMRGTEDAVVVRETLLKNESSLWQRAYYISLGFHSLERIEKAFSLKAKDLVKIIEGIFLVALKRRMQKEMKTGESVSLDTYTFDTMKTHVRDDLNSRLDDPDHIKAKQKKKEKLDEEYEEDVIHEEDGVNGSRFGHQKEMATYEAMDDDEKNLMKLFGAKDNSFDENDYKGSDAGTICEDKGAEDIDSTPDVFTDMIDSSVVQFDTKTSTAHILAPLTINPSLQPLLMVELVEDVASSTIVREQPGITEAYIVTNKEGGKCLQTLGSNIKVAWEKLVDGDEVYLNKLQSNDVWAILQNYGVEAARSTLVNQIKEVFGAYGIEVDPRHLLLIGDFMTFGGGYRAMNRHQLNTGSNFLKMSFETTCTFLIEAVKNNSIELLNSPSARIVMGHPVKHGTGIFECLSAART